MESKLGSFKTDSEQIHSQLSELDHQLDCRERLVAELQLDNEYVSDDVAKSVSELGHHKERSNKNASDNETIESLIAEKSILERTIEGLERKVGSLEAMVTGTLEDNSTIDGTSSPPRTVESSPMDIEVEPREILKKMQRLDDQDTSSLSGSEKAIEAGKAMRTLSLNDGASDGYFFDDEQPADSKSWSVKELDIPSRDEMKIAELQDEVVSLRKELNKTNVIKCDLEFEKSTLEKVVLDLQKKVKLKIKANENGCSFVDGSHQESETDISSLEWDNLTEASEECKILTEELARIKMSVQEHEKIANELAGFLFDQLEKKPGVRDLRENIDSVNRLETVVHTYVTFSSEQIQRYKDEIKDFEGLVCKRDEDVKQLVSQESILANENELLNATLLKVKELAFGVLELFMETGEHRKGTDLETSTDGLSCEDIIRKVKMFVENILTKLSSETDAVKWKSNYEEILFQKSIVVRELGNARDELHQWKEKFGDLVNENGSLLESIDMLKQDLELMSQGQSAISAEREQLQTELDKLQFQIDTNETDDSKEIGELKMQLDDLKLDRERISKMVNDRDDFISEQQEKHDSLVYQLMEEKDRDLQEIQSQLEETMKLFKEKQDECSRMNSRNASLEEENTYIKERANDLESKLVLSSKRIEKLERELSDKMRKVIEKDVMLKSLEEEDEELREKEMIEEDMLREQEILIQDLRSENEYLRDALNGKELLLKKLENINDVKESVGEDSLPKEEEVQKAQTGQDSKLGADIENWKRKANEFDDLLKAHENLSKEIVAYKTSIETLENKLADLEGYRKTRKSPTIEEVADFIRQDSGENSNDCNDTDTIVNRVDQKSFNITEASRADFNEGFQSISPINAEEKRLVEDLVKTRERIRVLELEVETYKKFEMASNTSELEIEKLKSEISRMMQVLMSKDELLLNLQMMEDEVSSDSPFSSRARVIQHIRDKEAENKNIRDKCDSLEELAKHHSSQLDLLKVERQNLLIFLKEKEAEIFDLNEKLENIQARSAAKEHASTVLHAEHQKLTNLNRSQGSEIARLRERNQYLQNLLQEKQNHSINDKMISERNQELEIQIGAFQQEQERLLAVIHEKDDCNAELRRELESYGSSSKVTDREPVLKSKHLDNKTTKQAHSTSENDFRIANDSIHKHELELNELKDKLRSLNEINSKLANDNNELKQKLDLNENEKRKIRTLMENQNYDKSSRITDLESNLSDMEKRILDMNRNFEMERSRILQNFEARTKLSTQDWEEKVRLKDEEIKSLFEQIDILQSVHEHKGKSNTSDNSRKEEEDQLNLENKKLRSLYEEKRHEIALLQNDIYKLKSISSAHEAALNKMQNDNKYLIEEGSKKDSMIEEIERNKILMEQKVQELETEVHRLKVNCKEIEAKSSKDMERLRSHLIEVKI